MTPEELPFEFSPEWFALGLVTPERLAALRAEWERGEDRSPEHYRWRAFVAFLAERRPVSPELASALYELGARERDRATGEAMMHRVVDLAECPEAVLAAAAASGRRHLVRAVERRRAGAAG